MSRDASWNTGKVMSRSRDRASVVLPSLVIVRSVLACQCLCSVTNIAETQRRNFGKFRSHCFLARAGGPRMSVGTGCGKLKRRSFLPRLHFGGWRQSLDQHSFSLSHFPLHQPLVSAHPALFVFPSFLFSPFFRSVEDNPIKTELFR